MKNGARPKVNRNKSHPFHNSYTAEKRMSDLHDDLKEFEEFRASTLKAIRQDIKKGLSAAEIRKKYAAILQGRLITDALTTHDEKVAAIIAKDVIDRVEGKATEKREVTHKFKDLKDEELDAILKSEVEELEDMQDRFQN